MVLRETLSRVLDEAAALLPTGAIWRGGEPTKLRSLLSALALGPAFSEERAGDALRESDPRLTTELLSAWEAALGLPDDCLEAPESTAERRALVLSRAVGARGGTPSFFVALAETVGAPVTVQEGQATPARAGITRAGDTVRGELEDLVWEVFAPLNPVSKARAGIARAGDPLGTFGNELLECVLERYVPAHTFLNFRYVAADQFLRIYLDESTFVSVPLEGETIQVFTSAGLVTLSVEDDVLLVTTSSGVVLRVPLEPS